MIMSCCFTFVFVASDRTCRSLIYLLVLRMTGWPWPTWHGVVRHNKLLFLWDLLNKQGPLDLASDLLVPKLASERAIDQGARKETKTFASFLGFLVVKVNDAKTTRKQSKCSAYDNTKKKPVCIWVACNCFCNSWRKVKAERSDY